MNGKCQWCKGLYAPLHVNNNCDIEFILNYSKNKSKVHIHFSSTHTLYGAAPFPQQCATTSCCSTLIIFCIFYQQSLKRNKAGQQRSNHPNMANAIAAKSNLDIQIRYSYSNIDIHQRLCLAPHHIFTNHRFFYSFFFCSRANICGQSYPCSHHQSSEK